MGKFDLYIRCDGVTDLLEVDLTQEADGDKMIVAIRDTIVSVLESRGRGSTIEHYGGGCSVEIKKQEAADA